MQSDGARCHLFASSPNGGPRLRLSCPSVQSAFTCGRGMIYGFDSSKAGGRRSSTENGVDRRRRLKKFIAGLCSRMHSWIPGPPMFPDRPTLSLRSIAIRGILGHPAKVTGVLCGLRAPPWGGYRTRRSTVRRMCRP